MLRELSEVVQCQSGRRAGTRSDGVRSPGRAARPPPGRSVRPARQPRARVPEISITATAPSARFALPSDRRYLANRHVWARIEDGIATVGVTAPLGEVLWFQPEVDFW